MEEQPIVAARASVMIYDDDNKKWIHSGTSTGVSKVHIYQHITQNTFRVVGRKLHDHELVINCSIIKGLKYNKATPTFHQWRDTKQVYGLNFSTKEDAENFANSMFKVLEILNQHNLMINGNGLNNQQLNQNIINTQQLQHQPVYAHLNDTTQLIKQQYQAPPEYSEVVHTNNRTNGWTTQQQQQANQLSQPNSLDLNDWRQQQLQNDLNQLNLNSQLNGQQTVQIMNQMQPIYGHHRNSLPNQNAQLQQNAQLITQHQQLIQAQQQIQQLSNGLGQNNVPNNLNTSMQQPPNNQTIQQQQVLNSTQIQSTPQQQLITQQQQQQQPTSNQLNNNLTQQSAIPNPPSITQPQPPQLPQQQNAPNIPQPPQPPPPPPMPSNLSSNSTTSSNSTINSSIINKQSGNSLASALANAKLKKTPNKDDQKEKPSLGGGMASMLDEMTKTLARRRAQAESNNHTNGNCNGNDENDSISSRNSLKNGWDNKNKTSPNKDNDSNSRLRTGSADSSHHIEFDVEKLKQDIIMEMKKEMNKIKLEIIEAIKTELSRN